jgi:hypothetical protein
MVSPASCDSSTLPSIRLASELLHRDRDCFPQKMDHIGNIGNSSHHLAGKTAGTASTKIYPGRILRSEITFLPFRILYTFSVGTNT